MSKLDLIFENESPEVLLAVKQNPGSTAKKIAKLCQFSEVSVQVMLDRLLLSKQVAKLGGKYYDTFDFPEVMPDLTLVYKCIKNSDEGLTKIQIKELTGYPSHLVVHELAFLSRQKEIYYDSTTKRYHSIFKPVVPTLPNIGNVALLSRQELEALVKLFIQMITWGNNVISSNQNELLHRQESRALTDVRTPEEYEEEIEELKKQLANKKVNTIDSKHLGSLHADGSINLKF